ncbi:hypothetical protein F610DRAFT_06919 [Streptomyces sp. LaPpAH-199]|uniref:hypothetical protein n=1 Tax=Streptomyces TaxID=1883 RepID=UPI00088BFC75|nr:hypothetical protein [Streptomyces sp. LaPpAH-199]MYW80354.1 hypothetical protein [Streptomyces sp. SID8369]SDE36395.1 hypothetical protein F610DRAFT_06919 [Streptomyces sp. LaPpAH-199]
MPQTRPKPAQIRGLAVRFALIIGDPRLAAATHVSCTDDTISVHYPETHVTCRLRRLPKSHKLLVTFRAAISAPDSSMVEGLHQLELALEGRPGTHAQREAILRQLHAHHYAAVAAHTRLATRLSRHSTPGKQPWRDITTAA